MQPADNPNDVPIETESLRSNRKNLPVLLAVTIAAAGLSAAVVKPLVDGQAPQTVSGQPTANLGSAERIAQTDDLLASILDGARSLDGSGNNLDDPALGQAGQEFARLAEANYADGVGEMVDGPPERYLSNRIFNDSNQNIFSENGVTHWGFVWGQFLDHTISLREAGDEDVAIGFDPTDPLEDFTNDLGGITTTRSAAAAGTGSDTPRQQVNTISSFIDGLAIYGGTDARLDWLREGTLDGDPTNNDATLILDGGYLPTAAVREGVDAPETDLIGRLFADPSSAVIAGDVRVNENIGLTAAHTLFVREHNRIVDELPDDLDEETKFQIARRVVGALQQYITYNEFLPAMGVELDRYTGYDPTVDPSITNEFATVGYRAHSQIHGEFEAEIPLSELGQGALDALEAQGVTVETDAAAGVAEVAIPLNVAFGNPGLLEEVGLGNLLAGLSSEAAYANDGQIDNQLRSVLFQIPGPGTENPLDCLEGEAIADCFSGVNDLGALDVLRAYDHGMPSYNDLRIAYGLNPVGTFTELTGEETESLGGLSIDDPAILEFVHLEDGDGNVLEIGSDAADAETVMAERRTTVAARLAAIFDDVNDVDAFTGMVSEPHVAGTEFGELQLAMWQTQFTALRDGDRFFYGNDPLLTEIAETYGIDFRRTLADVIVDNSDVEATDIAANVFLVAEDTESATEASAADPAADAADEPDDDEPEVDRSRRTDRGPDRDRGGRRRRA
ncbi:MAG: peroxidase family protein [Acidimicrobiales bacterium]